MKPILFNANMVRAIQEGRKTVTRRAMKPQPVMASDGMWSWKDCQWMDGGIGFPASGIEDYAPYHPGDILWVRETWAKNACGGYFYRADEEPTVFSWRPSIHMPREAARLFLRVTGVRVERLREITPEDCIREGVEKTALEEVGGEFVRGMFHDIWDGTIKPADLPLYGWEANPWVWVIGFEKISREEALKA